MVVFATLFLIQTGLSSPILDFFNQNNSPGVAVNESPDHDVVPEINGGVMTEFFQTYSVTGEDTTWSEEQTGEEKIKNVPEIEIDVHDFLLITDPEIKAKPRSDNRPESRYPEVELSTENRLINTSTVSVLLNYSSSTTPQPIQTEKVISSSTSSSTSPPVPSASTPDNVLLSSTSSASVESLTSDSLISTSTSSLAGAATTSVDTLLFELDRLNKLNAAVLDLHTHEDEPITTETAQAQDRTDIIDDSLDDDDDESYDFFADMWNWLG